MRTEIRRTARNDYSGDGVTRFILIVRYEKRIDYENGLAPLVASELELIACAED